MNKLTEIKQSLEIREEMGRRDEDTICMRYLLSLLEEKDKALTIYADEENWGDDRYGNSKIFHGADEGYEIARKALCTSSNNEREV